LCLFYEDQIHTPRHSTMQKPRRSGACTFLVAGACNNQERTKRLRKLV
jgi:hypothetical protein